jgi:dTDP-4-amino-4,6-dideoxygalactose transaminase
MKVPLTEPYIGEEEKEEVMKVLDSKWLRTGKVANKLETMVKDITGADIAIATSSCTAALELALLAEGIGPGHDVITTPMTYIATIFAIIRAGATPVFADVIPRGYHMHINFIEECIRKNYNKWTGLFNGTYYLNKQTGNKLKAIIPVHYGGQGVPGLSEINVLAKSLGLSVIEDAAHSLGAISNNIGPIGSSGNWVCFSFHTTKNITTGEGGMLVQKEHRHGNYYETRIREMTNHGVKRSANRHFTRKLIYDVDKFGLKANMPDILAAVGVAQLGKLDEIIEKRKMIAEIYNSAFDDETLYIHPAKYAGNKNHAWHLYPLQIKPRRKELKYYSKKGDKWEPLEEFFRERGIEVSQHYVPALLFSYFDDYKWEVDDFRNCLTSFYQTISLPIFPSMTLPQVHHVIKTVREFVKEI